MSKRTWEQEKAYRAKRAEQAASIMEAAIAANDHTAFEEGWRIAMLYMNGKQRWPYYRRALEQHIWGRGI